MSFVADPGVRPYLPGSASTLGGADEATEPISECNESDKLDFHSTAAVSVVDDDADGDSTTGTPRSYNDDGADFGFTTNSTHGKEEASGSCAQGDGSCGDDRGSAGNDKDHHKDNNKSPTTHLNLISGAVHEKFNHQACRIIDGTFKQVRSDGPAASAEEDDKFSCGIDGCTFETKYGNNLRVHKMHVHNIDVVWYYCDHEGCNFRAKQRSIVTAHKSNIHDFGVVWHPCLVQGCTYRAKQKSTLKQHQRNIHSMGDVTWFKCEIEGCSYRAKVKGNLKRHYSDRHDIGVTWFHCGVDNCPYKAKQKSDLKKHKKTIHGIMPTPKTKKYAKSTATTTSAM